MRYVVPAYVGSGSFASDMIVRIQQGMSALPCRLNRSERFRRAEVDHELQFGGLQNWQMRKFVPLKTCASVVSHGSISIRDAAGITH